MDCKYCGQPAGWFRSAHRECAEAAEQKKRAAEDEARIAQQMKHELLQQLRNDVTTTLTTRGNLVDLEGRLLEHVIAERLTHTEMTMIVTDGWRASVDKFLEDGLLSPDEEAQLAVSRQRFSLPDAALEAGGTFDRVRKAAVLRRVMEGDAGSNMVVEDGFPIVLQRGEKAVWCFNGAEYLEDRTRRQFVGGSQGVSLRVMKGVYYRVGAFKGESVYSTERVNMGTGLLLVTDKNLYFHGAGKSLRIPYRKVVSFTPFENGIGLVRDAQTAKPQLFVTGDGWFTYNLVTNLARMAP